MSAAREGTRDDFPWLPPQYNPDTWEWFPNKNYDPSKPKQRPGRFEDPEGNSWEYDPNRKRLHERDHYDRKKPDGTKMPRIGPDGEVVKIMVSAGAGYLATRAADAAARRAAPSAARAAGSLILRLITMPVMMLEGSARMLVDEPIVPDYGVKGKGGA